MEIPHAVFVFELKIMNLSMQDSISELQKKAERSFKLSCNFSVIIV